MGKLNNEIYRLLSDESREILDAVVYCSKKLEISSEELLEALKIYSEKIENK